MTVKSGPIFPNSPQMGGCLVVFCFRKGPFRGLRRNFSHTRRTPYDREQWAHFFESPQDGRKCSRIMVLKWAYSRTTQKLPANKEGPF